MGFPQVCLDSTLTRDTRIDSNRVHPTVSTHRRVEDLRFVGLSGNPFFGKTNVETDTVWTRTNTYRGSRVVCT